MNALAMLALPIASLFHFSMPACALLASHFALVLVTDSDYPFTSLALLLLKCSQQDSDEAFDHNPRFSRIFSKYHQVNDNSPSLPPTRSGVVLT